MDKVESELTNKCKKLTKKTNSMIGIVRVFWALESWRIFEDIYRKDKHIKAWISLQNIEQLKSIQYQ